MINSDVLLGNMQLALSKLSLTFSFDFFFFGVYFSLSFLHFCDRFFFFPLHLSG